jgi:hypothetical protein
MSLYLIAIAALSPPAAVAPPAPPPVAKPAVRIPKGTPLYVALAHGVSAKTARSGDRVMLRTTSAIVKNGVTLIAPEAQVFGSVARVEAPSGGRPAFVVIDAEAVLLEDGRRLLLDGELTREGQDYRRSASGGGSGPSVGASLRVPLGRKNISPNLEAGTVFVARTAKDY